MKSPISPDVWEKKKALIARLYMEEEWPLKQVIKQIRSAEFNPSETQLRSRLKKWRVTKPSRQTRKKIQLQLSNHSGNDPHTERACHGTSSPASSKKRRPPQLSATGEKAPTATSQPRYARPELSPTQPVSNQPHHPPQSKLNQPLMQRQLSPISPPGDHPIAFNGPPTIQTCPGPRLNANAVPYPQSTRQTSGSQGPGLFINTNTTSAVNSSYPTNASYPLSPESCLPSPGVPPSSSGMVWPTRSLSVDLGLSARQWYSMALEPEPVTPPSGLSQQPSGLSQSQSAPEMGVSMSAGPVIVPQHEYEYGYSPHLPHSTGDALEYHPHGYTGFYPWEQNMAGHSDEYPPERKQHLLQSHGPDLLSPQSQSIMGPPFDPYMHLGHEIEQIPPAYLL